MKMYFRAFFLFALYTVSASAQRPVRTKTDCIRVCNKIGTPPAVVERHERKMKQLKELKKSETDPEKIKGLERDETDEIERFDDERMRICETICESNPDK